MKSKNALQLRKSDEGDVALMAWKILGGVFVIAVIGSILAMVPELTRYLKLKNM